MWKSSGYPLNMDDISGDQIYIGWREILVVKCNTLSSLRTGRVLSDDTVALDDCSLSRDNCAIVRRGKCRIIGLHETFEHDIESIDGVKQVSMMANERVALRTTDAVYMYDYGKGETKRWQLPCSQIAAGFGHIVALSNDGKVYVYGDGSRGQQGGGDLSASGELAPLTHLEDLTINEIAAGGWHSVALSDRGFLYQWGWNQHGQSGGPNGDKRNVIETPKYLEIGARAEHVQCGARHTVVLTEDGSLCSWGWDDFGQCSKITKTCCSGKKGSKLLRAAFWTTAFKLCEDCS